MRFAQAALAMMTVIMAACGGDPPPPAATGPAPASPTSAARPAPAAPAAPAPDAALLHGAKAPTGEALNKIHDIQQDLESLAAGRITAADLASDINAMADPELDMRTVQAVAGPIAEAIKGKTLDRSTRDRLAASIYAASQSPSLTPQARTAIGADLAATLRALGAPAPVATRASNAAEKIQSAAAAR